MCLTNLGNSVGPPLLEAGVTFYPTQMAMFRFTIEALFLLILSPYQSFVVLSNFCHLLAPCYLFTFYVMYTPHKCTCCTHHEHNSLSCLIVRTLSAPIYLSNSPGVFGHRAILIWGDRDIAGGFLEEQPDTHQDHERFTSETPQTLPP